MLQKQPGERLPLRVMLQIHVEKGLARSGMLRNYLGMLQVGEGESLALEGMLRILRGERLARWGLLQIKGLDVSWRAGCCEFGRISQHRLPPQPPIGADLEQPAVAPRTHPVIDVVPDARQEEAAQVRITGCA